MFKSENCKIDTILAFKIPECRAFMHLDTVFTQIDVDKFTYHPGIMNSLEVYEITRGENEDDVKVKQKRGSLEKILEEYLKIDSNIIEITCLMVISIIKINWL